MRLRGDMHLLFRTERFLDLVTTSKKLGDRDLYLIHENGSVYLCPPTRVQDDSIMRLKPYSIYNWEAPRDKRFRVVDILDMSTKPFRRLLKAVEKADTTEALECSRVEIIMSDRGYCLSFLVGFDSGVSPWEAYNNDSKGAE